MIDGKKLIKNENDCYNCGCNLKPVCPDYEGGQENGSKSRATSRKR